MSNKFFEPKVTSSNYLQSNIQQVVTAEELEPENVWYFSLTTNSFVLSVTEKLQYVRVTVQQLISVIEAHVIS